MLFKLEEMKPIDPEWVKANKNKNESFNPFLHDSYNMGMEFSKDIMFMYSSHNTEEYREGYFVNTKTGERQKLIRIKG